MTVASAKLQQDVKSIMDSLLAMRNEGLDIYNLYWKGGVTGDISALSSGDPVSYSTRLNKGQLASALTLADQLGNIFFENASVTTGDYMATCQVLQYGYETPTLLTPAVEGFAAKAYAFARSCVDIYNKARNCENFYSSVLYASIAALASGSDVVPGSDMTKDEILAAIDLIQQYQKFIQNQAVTTGYYRTVLGIWSRF